jgi:hypothetical protein
MAHKAIAALLHRSASTKANLDGLREIGLADELLAEALAVSESDLPGLADGTFQPTNDTVMRLDDLRMTALFLAEPDLGATPLTPAEILEWLTTPLPEDDEEGFLPGERPIDQIGLRPASVQAAAHALIIDRIEEAHAA